MSTPSNPWFESDHLRDAVAVLRTAGFRVGCVHLTPNRGAAVAALTGEDLEEAFPIMAALEAVTGKLAARTGTDAQIVAILRDHARMRAAFEVSDRSTYLALNEAIHLAIAEASGKRHTRPDAAQPRRSGRGR